MMERQTEILKERIKKENTHKKNKIKQRKGRSQTKRGSKNIHTLQEERRHAYRPEGI